MSLRGGAAAPWAPGVVGPPLNPHLAVRAPLGAPPDRCSGRDKGTLTVAGEGEGLPQAVTHHRHLQAHAMAKLLGAEVHCAPHQASQGIVLGAVAGAQPGEAGMGQGCCPALGLTPAPQSAPVVGRSAAGGSSPMWVLTHPACGRTQPPPRPAPRTPRRARSHWRRSEAEGQPVGQSTSP